MYDMTSMLRMVLDVEDYDTLTERTLHRKSD